eukprot:9237276-Lingulodinium_polyedra.AAC.1
MRSNRPSAVTTTRKSHARALHANANFLARAWSMQTRGSRAAATANGRALLRFKTLRNDAAKPTVRRRDASQIA